MDIDVLNSHLQACDAELYGVEYQQIADKSDLSKTYVQMILKGNNKSVDELKTKVLENAQRVLRKKAERLRNQARECSTVAQRIGKLKEFQA
jgi:uncharacterized Rossmann fold enzyme